MNNYYRPFAVNCNPFCVWDTDIRARNLEMLNSLDPKYFDHVADTNYEILENPETEKRKKQYAAISLRIAYSHGLETLFALLSATVQAPDCAFGWMLSYQPGDLVKIVKKITEGTPVPSNFQPSPKSWADVAAIVLSPIEDTNKEVHDSLVDKFGNLWNQFAHDFANPNFAEEHNSLKHGLRAGLSGFYFVVDDTNSPDLTGNPMVHANSEFGSNYFSAERVAKYNYVIHRHSRNWNPIDLCFALDLVAASIRNVIAYLKASNGLPHEGLQIESPTDEEHFRKPWATNVGISDLRMSSQIDAEKTPFLSKEQILSRYPKDQQ